MSLDLLRIRTGQQICRRSLLPYRGTVLVRTGQKVKAGDRIAKCILPDHFNVLDIVNSLKIDPKRSEQVIEKLVGEKFEVGDILAQKPGLVSKIIRAKENGIVVSIFNGKMTLALGEKVINCYATFPGVVVEIIPERGANICGNGVVLQGVWGNGKFAHGQLVYLGGSYQSPFDQTAIGPNLENKIIVMGACTEKVLWDALVISKPAGVVVSTMSPFLISAVKKVNFPVMSLVGFGDVFIDPYSEEMILKMLGKLTYLNAHVTDLHAGIKPEIMMPTEIVAVENLFEDESRLSVGAKVRFVGKPYTGGVGKIVEILPEKVQYASGLWLDSVVVRRSDGEEIKIPTTNIEIIVE